MSFPLKGDRNSDFRIRISDIRFPTSDFRFPPWEGPMAYQLVGKVKAYQGNDG